VHLTHLPQGKMSTKFCQMHVWSTHIRHALIFTSWEAYLDHMGYHQRALGQNLSKTLQHKRARTGQLFVGIADPARSLGRKVGSAATWTFIPTKPTTHLHLWYVHLCHACMSMTTRLARSRCEFEFECECEFEFEPSDIRLIWT
jgi:hypothetical protein